ncbi:MAG: hypothetical protein LBR70_04555 [Lactobacillaceae bacterium]|jgi:hypothetical protein|nr:hypothetical protein [Lactobacillaceae bacterium]
MRIIFAVLLLVLTFISSAFAEDAKFYANVFNIVRNEYLHNVDVQHLAESGLNGLSGMDKKIKIADGAKSSSLYYNGRIAKTIVKPTSPNSLEEWGDYTKKFIDAAIGVSPEVKARDFETAEYVLMSMFENLDKDTRYYPYLEIGDSKNAVKERYFADRMIDDKILYMKLGPLNLYTRDSILSSFEENEGFEALIIDLRGNPGGLLSEAVSIMKVFLDQGIIASSRARKDGIMKYYTADEGSVSAIKDKPVVVLVDGDTASSAEVLAAGLKEQSIAKVVGTKTKGKGTVQKLIVLDNGGELVLTTANFYTPSGKSVNEAGIRPNVCMFDISNNDTPESVLGNRKNLTRECRQESRKDYDIDLDVAIKMLEL